MPCPRGPPVLLPFRACPVETTIVPYINLLSSLTPTFKTLVKTFRSAMSNNRPSPETGSCTFGVALVCRTRKTTVFR